MFLKLIAYKGKKLKVFFKSGDARDGGHGLNDQIIHHHLLHKSTCNTWISIYIHITLTNWADTFINFCDKTSAFRATSIKFSLFQKVTKQYI